MRGRSEFKSGEVKLIIHAVLPIEEAEKVHEILYQGKNIGNVVITV